ncbi:MAG: DUF531 domain-containing protein [Euryarchaeota archaeon]|nr:DUF531 domain-containing protein [Euryarchaeota archaeon]
MDRKRKGHPHWPSYARKVKREARKLSGDGRADFGPLIDRAGGIGDPYYRAQALAWVGRFMAASGREAGEVFSRAVRALHKVEQEWRRAEVLAEVAREAARAGIRDFDAILEVIEGMEDPSQRKKAWEGTRRSMKRAGVRVAWEPAGMEPGGRGREPAGQGGGLPDPDAMGGRITLGLVNTYRGNRLREAHVRGAARAGPLCYAFGLNLCLLGFPVPDEDTLIERVGRESKLGEGGSYLLKLREEGRLAVAGMPEPGGTEGRWTVVATTSRPDGKKRLGFSELREMEGPLLILMGLGSQGLPARLLKDAGYHLEFTGRNVALETCTAMGVLAAKLGEFSRP